MIELQEQSDPQSEAFLRRLMRKQLQLSIYCAATFLVALLVLPLANYFLPDLMNSSVKGFTLSWLILGVLFFPFVCIVSRIFIVRSTRLENEEIAEAKK